MINLLLTVSGFGLYLYDKRSSMWANYKRFFNLFFGDASSAVFVQLLLLLLGLWGTIVKFHPVESVPERLVSVSVCFCVVCVCTQHVGEERREQTTTMCTTIIIPCHCLVIVAGELTCAASTTCFAPKLQLRSDERSLMSRYAPSPPSFLSPYGYL